MKLWLAVLAVLSPLPMCAEALKVLETPTSPLQVNAPAQNVVVAITLVNTSDVAVKGVTVEPPSFTSDTDAPIMAEIKNRPPSEIQAHKTVRFVIDVTLPKIRTYSGLLRIDYVEKAEDQTKKEGTVARAISMVINITRTRPSLNIEVADSGAVSSVLGAPIDFNIHVRNNDYDQIELVRPLIVAVTEKSKDDKAVSGIGGVSLTFAQPGEQGKAADQQPEVGSEAAPARIPGNSDIDVPFVLSGIERPGKYDIAYRLSSSGEAAPIVRTVTVYARERWAIFLLWVALGLAASLAMRAYSTILRPRLLLERKVAVMLEDLSDYSRLAGSDPEAVALMQELRGQIANTWNRRAIAGHLVGSAVFETFEEKVAAAGQWLERWKSVRDIQPVKVRDIFQRKLRDVANVLITPGATDIKAQTDLLATLRGDIDRELATALASMLQALKSELHARNDPRFDALVTDLDNVQQQLSAEKFEEAYASMAGLRRRLLTVLADDVLAKLDPGKPVPGFDDTTWPAVVTRTADFVRAALAQTDSDAAAAAFTAAVSSYLRSVTAGVSAFVAKKITEDPNGPYKAVQPEVAAIGNLIAVGKLDEAKTALDAVTTMIGEMGRQAGAEAAISTADVLGEQMPILTALLGFFAPAPDASVLGRRNHVQGIDRTLTGLDLAAGMIAVVLTAITGYATLWTGDLTWGGWPAYAAAVLWGAGIHQLTWTGIGSLFTALK